MRLEPQCLLLVLANVELFGQYGDQSTILWEQPKERQSITVAETNLEFRTVMKVFRSLRFVRSQDNPIGIHKYCSDGISEQYLEELQRDIVVHRNVRLSLKLFDSWKTIKKKDKPKYYNDFATTEAYNECLKLFNGKDVNAIEFTQKCDYTQLLQGIVARRIGIRGLNRCFAPYVKGNFYISTPQGFPLIMSRDVIRFDFHSQGIMFVTLVGEVYMIKTFKSPSYYLIDDRNKSITVLKAGVSYETVWEYMSSEIFTRVTVQRKTKVEIGCKLPKPDISIKGLR